MRHATLLLAFPLFLAACASDEKTFSELQTNFLDIDSRAVADGGEPTAVMPTSGTASYAGSAAYFDAEIGDSEVIAMSEMNLKANFATQTINGSLSNFVLDDGTRASGSVGITATSSGADATGTLDGSLTVDGETFDYFGSVEGGFVGDNAQYMAFLIYLQNLDPETNTVYTTNGVGVAER